MLVFIDESGDTGLKIQKGSSQYFVVTLLVFGKDEDALIADQQIQELREEFAIHANYEFHFNKMTQEQRKKFFAKVAPLNWYYFSIVINKAKLKGPGFAYKDSFYKCTCRYVFENAKPHLENAKVTIDGSGSRKFRTQLSAYLKSRINESSNNYIRKVRLENSKNNNLIQMADMVCGAIARCYSGKNDALIYRPLILHQEVHLQVWPS